MKKISIILMCVATLAFASCSALSNAASNDATAAATGRSCATSLISLYQSYKSVGKIDLTNPLNLSNAIVVASAYTQLKQNKGNESYRKAFTSGMISAGAGVITNSNADAITTALSNSTGLTNLNAQNANQSAQSASSILSLMKAMQ